MAAIADYSRVALLLPMHKAGSSFIDYSRNGVIATPEGGASITSDAGSPYGHSGYFDGSGYLLLPNIELGGGDFEITVKIRTASTLQYACVVSKDQQFFQPGSWTLLINNGSTDGRLAFWARDYNGSTPLLNHTSGPGINDNVEHEISLSRTGSTWKIQVDGIAVATASWSGAISGSTSTGYAGYQSRIAAQYGYSRTLACHMRDFVLTLDGVQHAGSYTPAGQSVLSVSTDPARPVLGPDGSPAVRAARFYDRASGLCIPASSVTSAADGHFSTWVPDVGEVQRVLVAPSAVPRSNDLIDIITL